MQPHFVNATKTLLFCGRSVTRVSMASCNVRVNRLADKAQTLPTTKTGTPNPLGKFFWGFCTRMLGRSDPLVFTTVWRDTRALRCWTLEPRVRRPTASCTKLGKSSVTLLVLRGAENTWPSSLRVFAALSSSGSVFPWRNLGRNTRQHHFEACVLCQHARATSRTGIAISKFSPSPCWWRAVLVNAWSTAFRISALSAVTRRVMCNL